MALRAVSMGTGRVREGARGGGGLLSWFDDATYSDLAIVSDFNNDQYALPAYGPELVTSFTGFTTNNTATGSVSTNGTQVTLSAPVSGDVARYRSPALGTTVGGLYQFKVSVVSGSTINIFVGSGVGLADVATTVTTSGSDRVICFTATSANSYISLTLGAVNTTVLDNVSVREIQLPFGEERVINGTFATDLTGWTDASTAPASVTWSGGAALFNSDGAAGARLQQSFATTVGALYQVSSSGTAQIAVGTSAGSTTLLAYGAGTRVFVATTTTTWLNTSTVVNGQTLDNVSVQEIRNSTLGANLVSNGDFSQPGVADPTTGWVLSTVGGTSTSTISGGALSLFGDSTNQARADQRIATVAGGVYRLTVDVATNPAGCIVGSTLNGFDLVNQGGITAGAAKTFYFVAVGSLTYVRFFRAGAGTTNVDNVSVQLVTPAAPKRSATFDEVFAYTASSTTARTYVDAGGVLRDVTYGLTNLLVQSQNFASASWSVFSSAAKAVGAATTAPDGTSTTDVFTTVNTDAAGRIVQNFAANPSTTYTLSFYVKSTDGSSGSLAIQGQTNNGVDALTTVSFNGSWQRVQAQFTTASSLGGNLALGLRSNAAQNLSLYIWGAQLEFGSIASNYLATTSTARQAAANARRMTYANGKRQLRLEDARTNLFVRSGDLSNASWAKEANLVTAPVVTAAATTGPDGQPAASIAYPAWTQASNGQAYSQVRQNPGTTASTAYTITFYMKGSVGGEVVNIYAQDGSNFANLATTAVTLTTSWQRFTYNMTSGTGTSAQICLGFNGSFAAHTNKAAQTIYVTMAQCELGAFASDYIPTTTAAVTRAIETARFSPLVEAILQRTAASVVVRAQNMPVSGGRLLGCDFAATLVGANSARTSAILRDQSASSVVQATPGSGSFDTAFGIATGFDASGESQAMNNGTVATGTTALQSRTKIYLGRSDDGVSYGFGYYDAVMIAPTRLSNARLQALAVAAT